MKYREIGRTGMNVSSLSFGASSLGGVFHSLKEEAGIEAVHTAVDHGINFIDVSPYYGHLKAEIVLGKALKNIKRDRYYLSTKVGRYGMDGINSWDYSAKKAQKSVYESLERLNVVSCQRYNVATNIYLWQKYCHGKISRYINRRRARNARIDGE